MTRLPEGLPLMQSQTIFDKNGKEVYRHCGFMSEKVIVAQLETMGVKKNE
jgi:hypothetical protein